MPDVRAARTARTAPSFGLMGGDDDAASHRQPLGTGTTTSGSTTIARSGGTTTGAPSQGLVDAVRENDESGALALSPRRRSRRQREQAPHDAGAARRWLRRCLSAARGPRSTRCRRSPLWWARCGGDGLRDDAAVRRGAQGATCCGASTTRTSHKHSTPPRPPLVRLRAYRAAFNYVTGAARRRGRAERPPSPSRAQSRPPRQVPATSAMGPLPTFRRRDARRPPRARRAGRRVRAHGARRRACRRLLHREDGLGPAPAA